MSPLTPVGFDRRRAIVHPGPGATARWTGSLVVIGGEPAAVDRLLAELTADYLDGPPPGQLIDSLRAIGPNRASISGVAAAIDTPAGIRLVCVGSAGALVDGRDAMFHAVEGDESHREAELDHDGSSLELFADQTDRAPCPLGEQLDLRAGIVAGGGATILALERAGPPSEPEAAPEAVDDIVGDFTSIDLRAMAQTDAREPLPIAGTADPQPETSAGMTIVKGIQCSRGHFNNPAASYCQLCGISMVHLTHNLVDGPRPTLGFAVFDDGSTYALDRSYVIGRAPDADRDGSGSAEALVADDVDHTVSRAHAELHLDGWNVMLRDLGSTNGTYVWDPSAHQWNRMSRDHEIMLQPGSHIALGRKTFVFESAVRE